MRTAFRSACLAGGLLLAAFAAGKSAVAEVVVIGGAEGLSWESGGGDLPAVVIRSATAIEKTNAPGGVIDFEPEGRSHFITPQLADTTRNIAVGINSPLRGGSIKSPNNRSIGGALGNLIDNDGDTALDMRASGGTQSARVLGLIIDLDLGARFWPQSLQILSAQRRPLISPRWIFPSKTSFCGGMRFLSMTARRKISLKVCQFCKPLRSRPKTTNPWWMCVSLRNTCASCG